MKERKTVWDRVDVLHVERGFGEDDGFSVQEYAERYRMSLPGAFGRLQKLVAEGKLVIGWKHRNGRRVRAYRFPS